MMSPWGTTCSPAMCAGRSIKCGPMAFLSRSRSSAFANRIVSSRLSRGGLACRQIGPACEVLLKYGCTADSFASPPPPRLRLPDPPWEPRL